MIGPPRYQEFIRRFWKRHICCFWLTQAFSQRLSTVVGMLWAGWVLLVMFTKRDIDTVVSVYSDEGKCWYNLQSAEKCACSQSHDMTDGLRWYGAQRVLFFFSWYSRHLRLVILSEWSEVTAWYMLLYCHALGFVHQWRQWAVKTIGSIELWRLHWAWNPMCSFTGSG